MAVGIISGEHDGEKNTVAEGFGGAVVGFSSAGDAGGGWGRYGVTAAPSHGGRGHSSGAGGEEAGGLGGRGDAGGWLRHGGGRGLSSGAGGLGGEERGAQPNFHGHGGRLVGGLGHFHGHDDGGEIRGRSASRGCSGWLRETAGRDPAGVTVGDGNAAAGGGTFPAAAAGRRGYQDEEDHWAWH